MKFLRSITLWLLVLVAHPAAIHAFSLSVENGTPHAGRTEEPAAPAVPTLPPLPKLPPLPAVPGSSSEETTDEEESAEESQDEGQSDEAKAEADEDEENNVDQPRYGRHRGRANSDEVVFTFGDNAYLEWGRRVDSVIAIFGDVLAKGRVDDSVVAIGGNVVSQDRVDRDVVAVLGNVEIQGTVRGDVVAVLGSVTLAPGTEVRGDVVAIGGRIEREHASIHGQVVNVGGFRFTTDWSWFHAWLREGVLWGRPLATDLRTSWTWWLCGAFLGIYLLIALIVPKALVRCCDTLVQNPGKTILATILSAIIIPLLMLLLSFTVIGLPIAGLVILVLALAGKAALLFCLGRRFGISNAPLAVLVGAVLITLLYLIPVVGGLIFVFGGMLGMGMVSYTLIREWPSRSRTPKVTPPPVTPRPPVTPPPATDAAPFGSSANFSAAASPFVDATPVEATPVPPPPAPSPAPEAYAETDPVTAPRAGFGLRFCASLIDVFAVAILVAIAPGNYFTLFLLAYLIGFWTLRGTTLGGVICGLQIIRLDGQKIDWVTATIRALASFISLIPLGLGFIWVAFDDEAQSWHDRIAGTTVIHRRSRRGLI